VHQPVLVFGIDRHVGRAVAVRKGGRDLAAQHAGVELQRFAALALKAEAGDDLHEILLRMEAKRARRTNGSKPFSLKGRRTTLSSVREQD